MFFRKKSAPIINSKYKLKDFVDFYYKDGIYFGNISNIYLDDKGNVNYDIDIAGQSPATIIGISEGKVVRLHNYYESRKE